MMDLETVEPNVKSIDMLAVTEKPESQQVSSERDGNVISVDMPCHRITQT
jgi:hypothetical protein